jgi:acid phosphatase type 7
LAQSKSICLINSNRAVFKIIIDRTNTTSMKALFTILLIAFPFLVSALTDKYRVIWRSDPSTTMVVAWNQVSGTSAIVYYGTIDQGTNYSMYPMNRAADRIVQHNAMNNHFARLTGLSPNTAYYFVIRDTDGTSARLWFKTAPATPDTRLSIVSGGDSRDGRVQRQNANRLVAKLRPHAVFFAGDMTHNNYDSEWREWFDDWQWTIGTDGRIIPIVVARGNHETSDAILVNHFDIPHNNAYYALTWGGSLLRLYTLNSEGSVAGNQTTWLANDLAASSSVIWKMAQYHRPMRPHAASKSEGNTMYQYWAPLFQQHRVNVVIECDAHVVKSTWPVVPSTGPGSDEGFIRNDEIGTVYIGEGGWGAPLRVNDDDKNWTRSSGAFNQVNWIFIDRDKIEIRFVRTDNANAVGTVSDTNVFATPVNLDVWSPTNGSVITINAEPAATTRTVTCNISSGTDDVEERSTGVMYVNSSDIELVYDNSTTGNQTVGLRFAGLSVPRGANVTEAFLQFYSDAVSTDAANLTLKAENAGNSLPFSTANFNVSSRARTVNAVNWVPSAWSTAGVAAQEQRSPDLKNIVQEVINRSDWSEGNALAIIATGTGKRTASAFEKSSQRAASLRITYSTAPTGPMPVTATYEVGAGGDDVEESSTGAVNATSSDIELVYDNSTTGNQVVGLRFQGVSVPAGSSIDNAFIQFKTDETSSASATLVIRGELSANALAFTTQTRNLSLRPTTTALVNWNPSPWTLAGEASAAQQSPNIKDIVREIITRNGWAAGNSMVLLVSGSGKRTARAFEQSGVAGSAKLVISYTPPNQASTTSLQSMERLANRDQNLSVELFPNSVNDFLTLRFPTLEKSDVVAYSFFSESGIAQLSGIGKISKNNSMELDVSSLPAGLYLVKLISREKTNIVKVIKR